MRTLTLHHTHTHTWSLPKVGLMHILNGSEYWILRGSHHTSHISHHTAHLRRSCWLTDKCLTGRADRQHSPDLPLLKPGLPAVTSYSPPAAAQPASRVQQCNEMQPSVPVSQSVSRTLQFEYKYIWWEVRGERWEGVYLRTYVWCMYHCTIVPL